MTEQPNLTLDRSGGGSVPERLPAAAWALAWSCLIGQLLWLAAVGTRTPDVGMALSVLLGPLIIGWVAAGVLTARTGRLVLAWIVLPLSLIGNGLSLVDGVGGPRWPALHLLASIAAVASLGWFTSTDYFAWQRSRPDVHGPSIAPPIMIAVAVGVLGGIVDYFPYQEPPASFDLGS